MFRPTLRNRVGVSLLVSFRHWLLGGRQHCLEAPDLLSLGNGLLERSSIQVCIGFFGVPIDVAFKVYVASSEVPSSSWESASSCSFGTPLFVRRRVER